MYDFVTGIHQAFAAPFCRAILLIASLTTLGSLQATAAPTTEDFARLPTFTDLAISPNGKYLAARVNDNNRYVVGVFDISSPKIKRVYGVKESDETSVSWFRWMTEEHLLASTYFAAGRRSSVSTAETRLITIDVPNSKIVKLFRSRRNKRSVQIQDRIVSFLPHEPEHILVQYSQENPYEPKVHKVNVTRSASHQRVQMGRSGVQSWIADRQGEVRIGRGLVNESVPFMEARLADEQKWIDLSHRLNSDRNTFAPLGFSPDHNRIYVLSNHESNTDALYLFDLEKDEFVEEIYRHPDVDISSIGVDPKTGALQRINFFEDAYSTEYIEKRPMDEDVDKLRAQYPQLEISLSSLSDDGNHAVLFLRAPGDPGRFYLFDRSNGNLRNLPAQYPGLEPTQLGKTVATSYEARDGLTVPAYVTLLPGMADLGDAKAIPFVVLPHGGPTSRDFLRFDYWSQFLVSKGYGVLQMNFRGSYGYGQEFVEAGDRQWGQAMQDDITDGVHWLVESDYADPDRIAIVGGSYGGYAALMGAVKTPEIYQCAVSFAGVSDLPELIRRARKYVNGKYSTRFVGRLWGDRQMLSDNSPARRAEDVGIPILLVHGNLDVTVDIDQSIKMANELKKHGKPHDFIRLEGGDHHLSLYGNRLRFLEETERFLGKCLQ